MMLKGISYWILRDVLHKDLLQMHEFFGCLLFSLNEGGVSCRIN